MRSAAEIKARCSSIMKNDRVVRIVAESSSPTATFDMVEQVFPIEKVCLAARWLAVLRRDYPDEYDKLMKSRVGGDYEDDNSRGTARDS